MLTKTVAARGSGASMSTDGETAYSLADIGWVCMAAACWIFTRQYHGVVGDSLIYLGRALADLSPRTVGQDLMFLHDGQSSFSLFPPIARILVAHFGAPFAGAAIALAGVCLWFAAFAALALRLAPRRLAWVMVIFVALLPATYGGYLIIPYGQAIAIPRPFAEAAVLAALWATLDRRWVLVAGFIGVAVLFHPIMALCGIGVVFLLLGLDDRRWFIAAGLGVALVIVAAGLRLPLADRLFHRVDAVWLDLLQRRNPYLFPSLWPAATWAHTGVQVATTVLAALLLKGRLRALFACVAIVGLAGVALSFLAGDLAHSLLIIQIQPWRTLWLVAVFAAAGAAICATELLQRGPLGGIALVLLAVSWLQIDTPLAAVLATAAVGAQLAAMRLDVSGVTPRLARLSWLLLILMVIYQVVVDFTDIAPILQRMSPDASPLGLVLSVMDFQILILAPIIWVSTISKAGQTKHISIFAVSFAVLLVISAALYWNAAPPTASFEGPDRQLLAIVDRHPGEVQWIDGDTQAWTLANRPMWASKMQGAGIVFAQDAALTWLNRIRRLIALNLIGDPVLTPWATLNPRIVHPSPAALVALCRTPGGPAWIISPVIAGQPAPPLPGVQLWQAPYVTYLRATATAHSATFVPVRTYAVVPCADQSSKPAAMVVARSIRAPADHPQAPPARS